jgi:hypothetical protein
MAINQRTAQRAQSWNWKVSMLNGEVNLIVSKNLDVMKNKAQFASKGGSVVFYVTKRVAGWNAVLRAG